MTLRTYTCKLDSVRKNVYAVCMIWTRNFDLITSFVVIMHRPFWCCTDIMDNIIDLIICFMMEFIMRVMEDISCPGGLVKFGCTYSTRKVWLMEILNKCSLVICCGLLHLLQRIFIRLFWWAEGKNSLDSNDYQCLSKSCNASLNGRAQLLRFSHTRFSQHYIQRIWFNPFIQWDASRDTEEYEVLSALQGFSWCNWWDTHPCSCSNRESRSYQFGQKR